MNSRKRARLERKSPEEEEGAAAAKVGDGALRPPLFFLTLLGMLAPAQKFINMSVFLGNSSTRAQYPRSLMPRERPNCKKLRKFVEFRLDNWGLVASGGGPPDFI